ncbi:MAG: hypothetical protein AAF982_08975, partial [Pseudomonadota bacterium]
MRSIQRTVIATALSWAVAVAIAVYGVSGSAQAEGADIDAVINVPANGSAFVLAGRIGRLPRGADLMLETRGDQFIGSVSAFGATLSATAEQVHHVVAMIDGLSRGNVAVIAKLSSGGTIRAATPQKFKGVRV